MGHELEIIIHLFILFGWVFFKFNELFLENCKMNAEFLSVEVRLPLNFILESVKSHRLLECVLFSLGLWKFCTIFVFGFVGKLPNFLQFITFDGFYSLSHTQ